MTEKVYMLHIEAKSLVIMENMLEFLAQIN